MTLYMQGKTLLTLLPEQLPFDSLRRFCKYRFMDKISAIKLWHEQARAFFARGSTLRPAWRIAQLETLRSVMLLHESSLLEALAADLGKPVADAYLSEFGWVLNDIRHAIRHLKRWSRPRRRRTPLISFPARSLLYPEPLGVVLILAPWNYPFQLLFSPLVAALAAGNVVGLKPSELTPNVAKVAATIIRQAFPPEYVGVWEGDKTVAETLLEQRFDHIFFTGSTAVGRRVMAAAAAFPTPVTLELGGKSPCIVCADADIPVAARRIAWGKFMNAGQVCVAPDYVFVERGVRDRFLDELAKAIRSFYGPAPMSALQYSRIVNTRQVERLLGYLRGQEVFLGGNADPETGVMEPTVLLDPPWESLVMREEIFGPVLPVLAFDELKTVLRRIRGQSVPLALYLFTPCRQVQDRVRRETVSGGMAINDVVVQIFGHAMPFGGVGESGMGAYHGKAGFDVFSHHQPVLTKRLRPDPSIMYPPYPGWKQRLLRRAL